MDLKNLRKGWLSVDETEEILSKSTIFDKIEFSDITKDQIREKLKSLDEDVSGRSVLLDVSDEKVKEHWFKNWLHPKLKHFVKKLAVDNNMTEKYKKNVLKAESLYFYENAQFNFNYSLKDIEEYVKK